MSPAAEEGIMTLDRRNAMARRLAMDIPEGAYVNLGIGLPTLVADHFPSDRTIFLHSENGILGRWRSAQSDEVDPDQINAGKEPIFTFPGTVFFDHTNSFSMMRGGHLDICVLGAFQVSANGDLANWSMGDENSIPAVGGAMDLAVGAKKVFVLMEHVGRNGQAKIVDQCTLPITGRRCVSAIYTDLAVIDIKAEGPTVRELRDGVSREELQAKTSARLIFP
jgi:3-oxoadipate CoA-transferase, beta subunit